MNALQYLWADTQRSHLRVCKAHKSHPAVPLLIKRYETAKADPNMKAELLDQV